MKAAELEVIVRSGLAVTATYRMPYESIADAQAEYSRIRGLLEAREERKNSNPALLDVATESGQLSVPLHEVVAVSWADYAKWNKLESGAREAYPNLFRG